MVPSLGGLVTMDIKVICMTGKVWYLNRIKCIAYIRGVNGEDLSTFIKSVTFSLHASFRQNQRGLKLERY